MRSIKVRYAALSAAILAALGLALAAIFLPGKPAQAQSPVQSADYQQQIPPGIPPFQSGRQLLQSFLLQYLLKIVSFIRDIFSQFLMTPSASVMIRKGVADYGIDPCGKRGLLRIEGGAAL